MFKFLGWDVTREYIRVPTELWKWNFCFSKFFTVLRLIFKVENCVKYFWIVIVTCFDRFWVPLHSWQPTLDQRKIQLSDRFGVTLSVLEGKTDVSLLDTWMCAYTARNDGTTSHSMFGSKWRKMVSNKKWKVTWRPYAMRIQIENRLATGKSRYDSS